jgi:hypothetical protein
VNQHLRVTSRTEDMAAGFELVSELGMVEDLTRRRNYYLAILIGERLSRAATIRHFESNMRQPDLPSGIESITIRASVPNRSGHPPQGLSSDTGRRLTRNAGYPAHLTCSGRWFSGECPTHRALCIPGVSLFSKWQSVPVIGERW